MSGALNEKPGADVLPETSGASILLHGRYLPPPEDRDGKQWVRTTALVQGDAMALYEMWRDVEKAPLWQEDIAEVKKTGETTSHWMMKAETTGKPDGKTIEWDAEVLADEPGKRIAWRTIGGESDQAGEVIFEQAPGGRGTLVITLQEFHMGKLASAWVTLTGRNPKQAVIENMRHFKALAETGEIPRSQTSPAGKRGVIGELKRSAYGEKIPTPAGTQV